MAKTAFNDGDPSMGILGTRVLSAFLNKIFTHRHDGKDEDGSAPLDYAVDTGAANACAIALTPALTAHVIGLPLHFKVAATNTGAATLAVNGLATVAVILADGSALNYGNLRAGGVYSVIYNGTAYVLLNTSGRTGQFSWEWALPAGSLKLNGALVSRATYPVLYAWAVAKGLIVTEAAWSAGAWGLFGAGDGATTFRLPDFQGEFVRGLDEGRGVDSGRTLGSRQTDLFKSHYHTLAAADGGNEVCPYEMYPSPITNQDDSDGSFTNSTGGTETRPRNIALIPCIKY